jgi:phthiodiolone/phenolphthiodiolone dimycocerosates ketoreductase
MLDIAGRNADGWWPVGSFSVEGYAGMLAALRQSAERAGRDPLAITTAAFMTCLIGDQGELEEIVQAPLIKAFLLQVRGDYMRERGFAHPMGDDWKGIHDINPATLTRDRIIDFLGKVDPKAVLAVVPHGSPRRVAEVIKHYVDAGLRVPRVLDYSGMAGLAFGARSAAKVRETEDELLRLTGSGL